MKIYLLIILFEVTFISIRTNETSKTSKNYMLVNESLILSNLNSSLFNNNFSNNSLNVNIPLQVPLHVTVFGTFIYSLIFLMGICGNFMVIIVLFKNSELRNSTNYFLANLSVADLLILFICIPIALHDLYSDERWYLGKIMCKLSAFIENFVGIASIFTMLFISCERFLAICVPFHVQRIITKSRTLKFILLIWIVSILINWPFLHLTKFENNHIFNDDTIGSKCVTDIESTLSFVYVIIVTFVIYLVIGIILLVIYSNICKSLTQSTLVFKSHSDNIKNQTSNKDQSVCSVKCIKKRLPKVNCIKRASITRKESIDQVKTTLQKSKSICAIPLSDLKSSNGETSKKRARKGKNNSSINNTKHYSNSLHSSSLSLRSTSTTAATPTGGGTGGENSFLNVNNKNSYLKPRKQLIFMLICVIVAFYVCIFPSKISLLVMTELGKSLDLISFYYLNIILRALLFFNSSINPILYNWLSTKFRRCFMKALGCNPIAGHSLNNRYDCGVLSPSTNCSMLATTAATNSPMILRNINLNGSINNHYPTYQHHHHPHNHFHHQSNTLCQGSVGFINGSVCNVTINSCSITKSSSLINTKTTNTSHAKSNNNHTNLRRDKSISFEETDKFLSFV